MVYYFTSTTTDPPATIYVGKDKTENEELIKYGWDEDVWYHSPAAKFDRFHVDNLSSAHVYLRLNTGQSWEDIPAALLEDCSQLTKANSIEGNKRDNVTVIYTPWSNLRKDGSMVVGQVSFHDSKKTKRILLTHRLNPIINRLNKTRTEILPPESTQHLLEARNAHHSALRKAANEVLQQRKKEEVRIAKERREDKAKKESAWEDLYGEDRVREAGVANQGGWDEDDFM